MARRSDDLFTDMLGGVFWTSTAIFTNAGPKGCIAALVLLIWFIVIPGLGLMMMNGSTDGSIAGWIGFIITLAWSVSVFVALYKLHAWIQESNRNAEKSRERKEYLCQQYSYISGRWILTEREILACNRYLFESMYNAKVKTDKERHEIWARNLALWTAEEHIKYEKNHGWMEISCEEWIQRNKVLWVRNRIPDIYHIYESMVDYWVPSMDELMLAGSEETKVLKINPMKRDYAGAPYYFDIVFYKFRKRRCEELSSQHAEQEYQEGRILPVFESIKRRMQHQENSVIPPPTIQQQEEWRLEDEATQQRPDHFSDSKNKN